MKRRSISFFLVLIVFSLSLMFCTGQRKSYTMTCIQSVKEAKEKDVFIDEYKCCSPLVTLYGIPMEVESAVLHYRFRYTDNYSDKKVKRLSGAKAFSVHFNNQYDLYELDLNHHIFISDSYGGFDRNCITVKIDHPSDTIKIFAMQRVTRLVDLAWKIEYDTIGVLEFIKYTSP